MITLCHQCRAKSACTSVQSDYTFGLPTFNVLILVSLKMIMEFQKRKVVIPFKKFTSYNIISTTGNYYVQCLSIGSQKSHTTDISQSHNMKFNLLNKNERRSHMHHFCIYWLPSASHVV